MNFADLPPELISLCFSYLNGADLARVSQICKHFEEITQGDTLWQCRCRKEFGLVSLEGWNGTFKEVYGLVLHKYGFLAGLWRNCTTFYGGLVTIGFKEDGRLVAEEWYALADIRQGLRKKELFLVTLTEDKQPLVQWLASYWGPQACTISPTGSGETRPRTINLAWKEVEDTEKSPENIEQEKIAFFEESNTRGTYHDLCMYKWLSHRKHQFCQNFTRLEMPLPSDKLPMTLGLYKGMYGGHGTEIVLLTHDTSNNKLNATKISDMDISPKGSEMFRKVTQRSLVTLAKKCLIPWGDPNVPAGEVSICADLSQPMVLTVEQQESLARLKSLRPEDSAPPADNPVLQQPFRVPNEVMVENELEYPRFCKARFHSQGTVSPMEFRNPTKIVNHFIVFDQDTFGILWIDLYSFSLFSRVQEDLCAS